MSHYYWKKAFCNVLSQISTLVVEEEHCPAQWYLYHNRHDYEERPYYCVLPEVWETYDWRPSRAWIKLHGRDWIELPSEEIKWKRRPTRKFVAAPKQKREKLPNKRLEDHPLYSLLVAESPEFWVKKIN